MSGESDLINLYSERILELATNVPHVERLDNPDATAKKRSPLCGSTVTVDIALTDGKITDYAQDVKACALGQAAAAVIGQSIIGRTMAEVQTARDELNAMLENRMGQSPLPRFRILRFCCLQKISRTVTPQSCLALMRRLRPLPSWITRTRKAIKHIPQKNIRRTWGHMAADQ